MTPNFSRLLAQFTSKGQSYTIIKRNEKVALCERRYGKGLISYEPFEIQIEPAKTFGGVDYPARERAPHEKDYENGHAYSCGTIERGRIRFSRLSQKLKIT